MKKSSCWFALAFVALSIAGCSEIERTYDCAKICDKYSECFDEDLDNSKCVDQCEDHGDDDKDFEQKANECEACVDDQSCTEASTECFDKCAEVVAVSTN